MITFWARRASGVPSLWMSPIRNFGELIRLGALDEKAAHELATKPMDALGLSYAQEDLVDRIFEQTGGRANLMVTVCDEIIKRIGRERAPSTRSRRSRAPRPACRRPWGSRPARRISCCAGAAV